MELKIIGVALRRRWYVLLAFLVLGVIVSQLLPSGGDQRYESTALLLARSPLNATSPALESQPDRYLQGELARLNGTAMRNAVAERLDDDVPKSVEITAIESSDVLEITTETGDPVRSQSVSQAFADLYLEDAQQRVDAALQPEITRLNDKIATLELELETVNLELAAAAAPFIARAQGDIQIAIPDPGLLSPNASARQGIIIADLQRAQTQLTNAELAARDSLRTQILENATLPEASAASNTGLLSMVVVFMFAILGVAAALLATRLSRYVLDEASLEELFGRDLDARIPKIAAFQNGHPGTFKDRDLDAQSELARLASLLELRTASIHRRDTSIMVVVGGIDVAAGSTTVATEVASTLSRRGARVLLLDADLDRPDITNIFQAPSIGPKRFDLSKFTTPVSGLHIAGHGEETSALELADVLDAVSEAESGLSVIVVDVGNILSSRTASLLSEQADQLVICASIGHQHRRSVEQAAQMYGSDERTLFVMNAPSSGSQQTSSSRSQRAASNRSSESKQRNDSADDLEENSTVAA